jgi:hypothetical protein
MELATLGGTPYMKRLSLLCLLALTLSTVAMANIIPTNTSVVPTGANFTWNYNLGVAFDQNVNSGPIPSSVLVDPLDLTTGGFVTIYDFNGYVAGSCAGPAGWTCTAQNVGFTPSDTLPTDSASIVNLTWIYTSGSPVLGAAIVTGFSAVSNYGLPEPVEFTSRGWRNQGQQQGSITDNIGDTTGPKAPTPEPATLALLGSGILAGAFRLKSILTVKR